MKPAFSIATDDEDGDCVRACIASILEMNSKDVPHWFNGVKDGDVEAVEAAWTALQVWLRGRGFALVNIPIDILDLEKCLKQVGAWYNEDNHWILTGTGKGGHLHAVVCRGGEIVHDPSYGNPHGIVGPENHPEGDCFWMAVIVYEPREKS